MKRYSSLSKFVLITFMLSACSNHRINQNDETKIQNANVFLGKYYNSIRSIKICHAVENGEISNCEFEDHINIHVVGWDYDKESRDIFFTVKTGNGDTVYTAYNYVNNAQTDEIYFEQQHSFAENPPGKDLSDHDRMAAGCIGNTVDYCLSKIRHSMSIVYQETENTEDQSSRTGTGRGGGLLRIRAGAIGQLRKADNKRIIIEYNKDNIIQSMSVSLTLTTDAPATFRDYSEAGIAETVWLMVGQSCPDTNPDKMFTFFNGTLKNTPVRNAPIDRTAKIPGVPYCGKTIAYLDYSSYGTGSSAYNPMGYVASSALQISR